MYAVFLDASKALDHVQYCKLFNLTISPLVLRLLLNIYVKQKLQVRWGNAMLQQFTVCNGVKQVGVLSPILFAAFIDGLLGRLKESGIGCHMGNSYVRVSIAKSAKASFWRRFNLFRSDLGHSYSFIKCKLFQQYCCSFYSAPLLS